MDVAFYDLVTKTDPEGMNDLPHVQYHLPVSLLSTSIDARSPKGQEQRELGCHVDGSGESSLPVPAQSATKRQDAERISYRAR